ncbi:MASE3 domain-containing protein [Azospirillum sp. TSO22-1]|uniref:MASE3 domain-containing protein n=1 Tax=Azospirillum sp. TSO22-1 TaxID=716789 RepID=UPI000D6580BA|nr:MASE3 domain-containing protein [Azospirillum sp. TSO22-1]
MDTRPATPEGAARPDPAPLRVPASTLLALGGAAALVAAYLVSRANYLVFHAVLESFRAVTALCVFVIAWNSRGYLKSGNLWFLGVTYACTGVVTLLHMLAYKGMGVFPAADTDLPTQLWTASRLVEATALCIAAFTPNRRFPTGVTVMAVGGVSAALLGAIALGVFPACYVEGSGLTPFKKASEAVAIALYAAAAVGIQRQTNERTRRRRHLFQLAVIANALGSLSFSLYVDVYGFLNFAGHALVAAADALVFAAFVRVGIKRPQELVFWAIEHERQVLRNELDRQNLQLLSAEAELEQGHAELEGTRQALDTMRARETAIVGAVGEGILCVDRGGRVTFANDAARRMLDGLGLAVGQPLPLRLVLAGAAYDLPLPDIAAPDRVLEVCVRPFLTGGDASVVVMRDVTARRALEAAASQHAEAMKRSLVETIAVVAQIINIRDPYTAGHQERVADLSVAIAREMGLGEEEVTGIYLAGVVHDIGKISVPAELLNRPGRLTPPEYNLLKTHARSGHDILCKANLPWPVAEIILQHHEKLDGSGYPQGLTGDAIRREARILAVADIIEAMASHRPYRPALGIEAALEEVGRCAGVSLDADVVAACLRLFRDKGYTLPAVDWGAPSVAVARLAAR